MYPGMKEKVRELRSAGKLYSEIRQILKLNVPKSTISTWCKGIPLEDNIKIRMDEKVRSTLETARVKARLTIALKRQKYLDEISKNNQNLVKNIRNNEVAKIALAMLYLGEGAKTKRGSVMFGNSEPNIIALFLTLFRQCYKPDEKKFRYTLQCRADQNVRVLELYWSQLTKIPPSQCYKVQIDPRTKGKPSKKKDYKGVCRIDYFSGHIANELKIIVELINKYYKFNFGPVV
jgi:hypothetical protein